MSSDQKNSDMHSIISGEIFDHDKEIEDEFLKHFKDDVSRFVDVITKVWEKWDGFEKTIEKHEQKAYVAAFFLHTINSLIISVRLLILGYAVASGNMARQALESVCMAILCSRGDLQYFKNIRNGRYHAHRATNDILERPKKFKVNEEGVKAIRDSIRFYHKYSHPSLLGLTSHVSFEQQNVVYIGASFDKNKIEGYRKEIAQRTNFASVLINIIEGTLFHAKWASKWLRPC